MTARANVLGDGDGRDDVREMIIGDYRIVYRLKGETAVLLTVFRSSRLFPTSLSGL